MKEIKLKLIFLIILINSNFVLAQEWKNFKSYQKETNNKTLIDGCWLKKDRKKQTAVWKKANCYNLTQTNGNIKYKSIREIRDFYKWFDLERIEQGHEIKWIGIVALATSQLSKLEMNFNCLFIVRNKEIEQFAFEGSKTVFSDAFPKLREVYFSVKLLKGNEAKEWDKNHGINEQCKLLQPAYNNLSMKAFKKLERMAKGKGIFWFAIPEKLKFDGDILDCKARFNYGSNKLLPIYLKNEQTL